MKCDLFNLENETAVVIGATGVLGGAMAQALASLGAKVAVVGRSAERGAERVKAIEAAGGTAMFQSADAMSRDSLTAARDRLLDANPMAGIDCHAPHDRTREAYITPEAAQTLIEAADPFHGCLIAIARFGGLRVPSEPLALNLADIDWGNSRFTVPACKTPPAWSPSSPIYGNRSRPFGTQPQPAPFGYSTGHAARPPRNGGPQLAD